MHVPLARVRAFPGIGSMRSYLCLREWVGKFDCFSLSHYPGTEFAHTLPVPMTASQNCCGPYHRSEALAPTPEATLRARFAAFK